ncbi:MAG: glutamine synthetase family protein [Methylophilaceae bacterium]|nr:glutamine synthetase family protein [Methylophilaceae bacterium]
MDSKKIVEVEKAGFEKMGAWLNARGITEVECLVPDMTGIPRGKILPRTKFHSDKGMRLPESVLGMTVTGEYPDDDAFHTVIRETDNDMVLRPDPDTVCMVPWTIDPTAQVIHDCFTFEDKLVEYAPRSVLRKVLDLYAKQGWKPVIAPELEFYILARNTDPDMPLQAPIGRSGRAEAGRQAYSIDAVNEFDPLFEDIYEYCDQQNLEIDTLIHEVGTGQMEINFMHGDPLHLADSVFLFKRTVREAAFRHEMYATFMAKPMADQPGSAMHIHQSVLDIKTGENLFANADGSDSDLFFHAIGGFQQYLPPAMVLMAPFVNSYRRLVRDNAAPINVQWGRDNRTVGIRIPEANKVARRIENRLPGVDANPYIAIATSLACSYLGMMKKIKPQAELTGNAYSHAQELPRSLLESMDLLLSVPDLHEVLGEGFIKLYLSVKRQEYTEYMKVISPWERRHLLLHV